MFEGMMPFMVYVCRNDVIPVVMGARPEDYAAVAPPHSYIHVDDYKSPRALAVFLKHLVEHPEHYNKYFKWKKMGKFIDTKFWCRLCAMLHEARNHVTWVKDVDAWWKGPDVCVQGRPWASWKQQNKKKKLTTIKKNPPYQGH